MKSLRLSECIMVPEKVKKLTVPEIDYQTVHERISVARSVSKNFLMRELNLLEEE